MILINDLLKTLEIKTDVNFIAFADDLKLIGTQTLSLQHTLNLVNNWCKEWQLKIQPHKSEYITFANKSINQPNTTFQIEGKNIDQVKRVRDLGISLQHDMKWNSQIMKIHSKSIRLVYTVIRSFKSNKASLFLDIYKTHIRPILEYNSNIWNPYLVIEIRKVEPIQKTFTKLICQKSNISYRNYLHRLEILQLETLEQRRLKSDLILTYKIQNNLLNIGSELSFTASNISNHYNLRRHNQTFKLPNISKSTVRQNFFHNRIVKLWNKLPQDLVSSKSLIEFKNKLKSIDLSKFYDLVF